MPRTALQNQQLKEERRDALMAAARQVFARKGLAASKMTDLAKAAGISYGLVYHYFPDKESVFAALVEDAVHQGIQLITQARQRPGSPWEQMVWLFTRMLENVREEPSIPLILVQAHASASVPPPIERALNRYGTQFFQQLIALIEDGQRAGQVVDTPAGELAQALVAMLEGLALMRLIPSKEVLSFPSVHTVLRLLKP